MPEYIYLIYILLGVISGITAGLLGLGGGVVIVPALAMIFIFQGFPTQHIMHTAITTSLTTIIFTSISSSYAHHRQGNLLWTIIILITPGLMFGAVIGALITEQFPSDQLRLFFGLFEMIVALQIAFSISPQTTLGMKARNITFTAAGIIIGGVSTLLGIGGGSLTVPFLLWIQIPIRNAVATSTACGLPIAIMGSIGLITAGFDAEHLVPLSLGYLHWPAALLIASSSIFFAPVGAKLAHQLPLSVLKKIFATVLFLIGLRMVF